MQSYISTSTAALLTGEAPQRIREKIAGGVYETCKQRGDRGGGNGGESYQIAVSSLPVEAQIIYAQRGGVINGPINDDCDLAGYHARFGDNGMRELLGKQRAVLEGLAIRKLNPEDVVEQLAALAEDHGTSLRTLYRWMDAYEAKGLPGIMRAVSRKDKGTRPSICAAAYQYAYGLYADKVKRTQATIYNKLVDKAAVLGPDACQKCIFCEGTEARARLMETGEINHYPPCAEPVKAGMRVPECRQTLSRMLAAIPSDEVTLARRGVKAWKDDHMFMALREKPQRVNEVWFGDHHQFTAEDVERINSTFAAMPKPKMIVTTEKDATRLEHLEGLSKETKSNIYALPIRIQFMLGGEEEFNNKIISYVRKNSRNSILVKRKNDHKA